MNTSIFRHTDKNINYYCPDISCTEQAITVTAPYNERFAKKANELGGAFKDRTWTFSRKDEIAVRKSLEDCFGYDGLTEPAKVDVEITFDKDVISEPLRSINVLARPLARIPHISKPPVIALGSIVRVGKIEQRGERVCCTKGTIVICRDVPIVLLDREPTNDCYTLTLITPDNIALESLFYLHDQHVARINEINKLFDLANTDIKKFGKYLNG